MYRIIDLSIISASIRLIVLFVIFLFLHGCVVIKQDKVETWSYQPPLKETIERNELSVTSEVTIERNNFSVARKDNVIGRMVVMKIEKGDTLPDIARHFSLGINEISAANPGVDIWVPAAGESVLLPLSFILPDVPRRGIVINLAAMRLFRFQRDSTSESLTVSTYPIGIGSDERPTPMGDMYVKRKITQPTWYVPASISKDHRKRGDPLPSIVPPGPQNPLGEYALYLNRSRYLIHGTNKPYSIGLKATNGCMRLYPEDIIKLYENTPVKTPVCIVNQPYLVGQHNGVVYMEVHLPAGDSDADELKKVYAKLRTIEKRSARTIDWKKVKETVAEARGIPVPILKDREGSGKVSEKTIEIRHPDKLYGRPEIPEMKMDAWYVLAANLHDAIDAEKITAIINHQGPQIPARVLSKDNNHRVVAGPFKDVGEAENAITRLRVDLEMEGILIEPVGEK